MPSQAEKLWYITVADGKAKVVRNGIALKSSRGVEYGCLLDVSMTVTQNRNKERVIQVGNFLFSGCMKSKNALFQGHPTTRFGG